LLARSCLVSFADGSGYCTECHAVNEYVRNTADHHLPSFHSNYAFAMMASGTWISPYMGVFILWMISSFVNFLVGSATLGMVTAR
jgi:hypothetical protein